MRYLLDTHLLLWLLASPQKVPEQVRKELQDRTSVAHYSMASIWEIAIKYSLGRLAFGPETVREHAERSGSGCVGIASAHLGAVARLPWQHRDPFDRLLVAQSAAEPMLLLTCDAQLEQYGSMVRAIPSSG